MKFEIDEIRKKLPLQSMGVELKRKGIIFETDFPAAGSQFYKDNIHDIVKILEKETGLHVQESYDTCYFALFDMDKYSLQEATEILKNNKDNDF